MLVGIRGQIKKAAAARAAGALARVALARSSVDREDARGVGSEVGRRPTEPRRLRLASGPSDEQLYGPWGSDTRVARGPRTFEQIRSVDPGFGQALCHMMDLTVETVVETAEELLAATEERMTGASND